MLKLVEEVKTGAIVVDGEEALTIEGYYPVNGEGRGFIARNLAGETVRFAKACGTFLKIKE